MTKLQKVIRQQTAFLLSGMFLCTSFLTDGQDRAVALFLAFVLTLVTFFIRDNS